jgi:chromosomal replication initiator protein
MDSIWTKTTETIRGKIGEKTYDLWFKPLICKEISDNRAVIEVPNKFIRDWITEHYLDMIVECLKKGTDRDYVVDLSIIESHESASQPTEPARTKSPPPHLKALHQRLNPNYTLETFVKGPSNEFAKAACEKVVENPAREYNPLFIYGGVGLGKTHLLNAVGLGIIKRCPDAAVYYITSEEFVNELVKSIRYEKMDEFRKKFRNIDVLLVDDIQFIAGKKQTQEEFFHTFNTLYENQKQIVLTSDKITKEIAGLEERLRSRFEWGLIADIDYPDMEHMVAILKTKAEKNFSIELPDDVAFFIATIVDNKPNIRELEGLLTRLMAEASLDGKQITLDFARSALKNFIRDRDHPESIDGIQKTVAKYFKIKVSDLKSQRRIKTLAEPRQIAMYLAKKISKASYPEIGQKFGGKDHSTVIHAVKKIERKIVEDIEFKNNVFAIENQIKLRG